MSTARNTTARKVATNMVIADIKPLVTSTTSFNEGDFLILDQTNHKVAVVANETDGALLMGVASCTVVNGILKSALSTDSDSSAATPSIPGPTFGDEYLVTLKSGDTAHPGDDLYLDPGTGNDGVTITAGTKKIGVWCGKNLTGDGTVRGLAKIGARATGDTLKF